MNAVTSTNSTSAAKGWLRALERTASIPNNPHRIFSIAIDELAEKFGDAPALLSDAECLTYRALAARANRYGRWALDHGLAKGDTVCLFMPNRPEFMAIWLGITRVGGIVSLLNTSLTGPSLAHCINLVAPKHIIAAAELVDALCTALPALKGRAELWVRGSDQHKFRSIDQDVDSHSGEALPEAEVPSVTIQDTALYIYTSGTTGLPKAAKVSHFRLMQWSHWFAGMMDTRSTDRMYNCLPMYHSVGGVLATGAVLSAGGSVIIREKFSAGQFWNDVVAWDCTLFQYIGEFCRYLLRTAPSSTESEHRIRMCCGNGLRPDVWDAFKSRFRIPQILEFYAATEGNVSLFNIEGKTGAIGRIPPFLAHRYPMVLIKFDAQRDEPVRAENGCCIRCAPDEVGEAIGRIPTDASSIIGRFDGYTSDEASEKKILRNVFEPGDAWFRTGDLMRKDEKGYFYFVDRVGDTFRWKGENVATSEVSEAICSFPGVQEANVYGVAIPGADGRAGMAAVVTRDDLDWAAFRKHLMERLPPYARPLFIRLVPELGVTATFKHTKNDLVSGGYNPETTSDIIYFNDPGRDSLVRVDKSLYDRIQTGGVRI